MKKNIIIVLISLIYVVALIGCNSKNINNTEETILYNGKEYKKSGARIQIVQVKMRIPYYKFYGTM